MDLLKRNVFWLALAGALVVALIAYALVVRPVRGEADGLGDKIDVFESNFKAWAKDLENKVPNEKSIGKIGLYRAGIDEEIGKVKAELLEAQFDLANAGFDPAPPANEVQFREWLRARYGERDAEAVKKKMEIRAPNSASRGDYPVEFESVPTAQRDIALKRFFITREVYKALLSVSMKETVKVQDPESDDPTKEKDEVVDRGVDALTRLVFRTPMEMATGRGGTVRAGVAGGDAALPEEPGLVEGRPYKEHLFELEFLCHYSLVPQVVRAVDGIGSFLLVIKRVDITTVKPSAHAERSGSGDPIITDTRGREAPVRVVLECVVLEFDFEAAEAKLGGKKGKN